MKTNFASLLPVILALSQVPAGAAVRYVSLTSTNPAPPYAGWATAATTIQDAIDAANAGDEIVVTNGVYATGGWAGWGGDEYINRVAVTKPVTVRSVNGPEVTIIIGDSGVRCAYLTNDATMVGFTLMNGSVFWGGGVWCASASAVVSNCVLSNNYAWYGGGANGGTLNNCTLIGNSSSYAFTRVVGGRGGGAAHSTLNNCTLTGNFANDGGGAYDCILNNCILTRNFARRFQAWGFGGGAYDCNLTSCTLTGNTAGLDGGGASYGTLSNCTVVSNSADNGGGANGGTLNNCTLIGNSAEIDGGGAWRGTLNNCTLINNVANWSSGGVGGSAVKNCIVYYNFAGRYGDNFDSFSELNSSCTTPLPLSGRGNFAERPLLMDLARGDFRLQRDSPCINAGLNAYATNGTDLDGNPRIVGGAVDVGAYEFQTPQSLLSYAWLQQYGLSIDGSADLLDLDGDHFNNFEEWRAGTDPTNALSALRLLAPEPMGPDIVVRWASVPGKSYVVERSTNITSSGSFIPIAHNVLGEADATTYTDPNVTTNAQHYFYRVGVE